MRRRATSTRCSNRQSSFARRRPESLPARTFQVRGLNDAVKGFLSPRGTFVPYLERPHLRVYVAEPHYLLAMKCAAMRLGEEFHDLDDVRYLLRHLDISTVDEAVAIVRRYFDEDQLQSKTRLALEELFST